MKPTFFDFEVFAFDWLIGFKQDGKYIQFWNDNQALAEYLKDEPFLVGVNNKHYDNFIMNGILQGMTPEQVKEVNDFIIVDGKQGWEHPVAKRKGNYSFCDLFDDVQMGTSLKGIEAHLGDDITETTVPFDIDRPLTETERREVEHYNRCDLDATEKLWELRKDYISTKVNLGKECGLDYREALALTNGKLTAKYLKAEKVSFNDEREYTHPENILWEYIPTEVCEFFDKLYDKTIPDDEIFTGKYEFNIGECAVTVGFGGIHGAIANYTETMDDDDCERVIRNDDVASYYPHLMTIDGYLSRAIPNQQEYADMLERRMEAKRNGDKATANALKLVANTTYGVTLDKYSDLYDPLMARSVCITGQLRLLELAENLFETCCSVKIIQLNTDGVMYSYDKLETKTVDSIVNEWQERTGFELESDYIRKIVQKDVNNYIEVKTNGTIKAKGGMLVRGISTAGAFKINNDMPIVCKAVIEYFTNGVPVSKTINECEDQKQFQIIARASSKYKRAFTYYDGQEVPLQKCNRVYASNDLLSGTIYKEHKNGTVSKIAKLPPMCLVDNDNHTNINQVNKEWYIQEAKKIILAFKGDKPKPKGRVIKKLINNCLYVLDIQSNNQQITFQED